ncbi:MAG TPA: alpha/beta fold hydrolase, partial [Gemmatimonadales bacterium]|nr:alpha/beta fold hydrolase [Gemmatimonadales bacterium]
MSRQRTRWLGLLTAYLLLLLASQLSRARHQRDGVPRADEHSATVGAVAGERILPAPVRIAFFDSAPGPPAPVVVLLHGSPGDNHEVMRLALLLASRFRVIAPDLPGFGGSSRRIPDYSIRAHAHYVLELLDSLRIPRAHVLGFSMGGGVALNLADLAPRRVASLTMLSAIGAQEYELLGDYYLNHAIHGIQLGGLWALRNLTPHFGCFDDGMLTREYARNFYDSDQRPLRGVLSRYAGPMLIIQGSADPLVPAAIAKEHARLVPQSELLMLPSDHFMAFREPRELAPPIAGFLESAERGEATTRATAAPERLRAAAQPFDPRSAPPANGIGFVVLLLLIAVATLVTEDFTCIATGLLVSRGVVGFLPGTLACFVGIVGGDLLLYGAGRWIGRTWFHPGRRHHWARFERASEWLTRRGPIVVLSSRFVPGSRLPTYVAAGVLHTPFLPFAGYFVLAAALWTPLLVGLAVLYGDAAPMLFADWRRWSFPLVVLAGLLLLVAVKLLVPLASWRGRRLLRARWIRLTRWEYWPRWAFYPPVLLHLLRLAWRHRSLTLWTAANPAMPAGGFVGESKWAILQGLGSASGRLAASALIPAGPDADARLRLVESFRAERGLAWPLVLKPDVGERGDGVAVVRSAEQALRYLGAAQGDVLAQEYVAGPEFGLFYYRLPGEPAGHVFSITEKRLPAVTADGHSTLERLILRNDATLGMAPFFLRGHAD